MQWYDPERDADVTVRVDSANPVVREMRRVARGDGEVLTVTYSQWNEFVDIVSPEGS